MEAVGGKFESIDHRILAMICCLILASATPDYVCINATGNMQKHGLLNMNKLAECSQKKLRKIIGVACIHKKRATFLIETAKKIRDNHGGTIPTNEKELMALFGVGQESCGFPAIASAGLSKGSNCHCTVVKYTHLGLATSIRAH